MRFLIDAQLPPELARRLRALGHEAEHVHEIGLGQAKDTDIWRDACRRRAVLVTKDQDFASFAASGPTGTAVIWIRLGNTTNEALWTSLDPLIPDIVDALSRGERLIEIV